GRCDRGAQSPRASRPRAPRRVAFRRGKDLLGLTQLRDGAVTRIRGLAQPEAKVEIEMKAVPEEAGSRQFREVCMPLYQRGDVGIGYEEIGSGFPLLVTPGGGLNSRVSNWQTAVFNAMEEFKHDFHCVTMDQRNANGGDSTGPVPVENAWDAFADD